MITFDFVYNGVHLEELFDETVKENESTEIINAEKPTANIVQPSEYIFDIHLIKLMYDAVRNTDDNYTVNGKTLGYSEVLKFLACNKGVLVEIERQREYEKNRSNNEDPNYRDSYEAEEHLFQEIYSYIEHCRRLWPNRNNDSLDSIKDGERFPFIYDPRGGFSFLYCAEAIKHVFQNPQAKHQPYYYYNQLLQAIKSDIIKRRLKLNQLASYAKTYYNDKNGKLLSQVILDEQAFANYLIQMKNSIEVFRSILPDFDGMQKRVFITHADVDHCGLLPVFDEILASRKTAECLALEYKGENGFREQNPLHRPYVNICKALTFYKPPVPEKILPLWDTKGENKDLLEQVGSLDLGELHFEVYEGKGGHLPGETVLIDYYHHVAFTGDIYVNIHGMTREQAEYNRYAPVLMTSVDTDPALCTAERQSIMQRLGAGEWKIYGSHGAMKEYNLVVDGK